MKFYDLPHIFDYVYVQWLCWPRDTRNVIPSFPQISKYCATYRGYHPGKRSAF